MNPPAPEISRLVEAIYREEYAKVLAATMRFCQGDLELAQDTVAEAFSRALWQWTPANLPTAPGAWLTTVSRRIAVDRLRRVQTQIDKEALLAQHLVNEPDLELDTLAPAQQTPFRDERLALFFVCCHPALDQDAQIALTLRTLGALSTEAIARAFLVTPSTMAQRLVRAKNKIKLAKIPYEIPSQDALPERLDGVLHTLYLIFNEGYRATIGDNLVQNEVCTRAIDLARATSTLLPSYPECGGLLALMLFHHARRVARVNTNGDLVVLDEQNRRAWHWHEIGEATQILAQALLANDLGPYQIQAAIAAAHSHAASADETDWQHIVALYDRLLDFDDSPVIRLNRIVARALLHGPQVGLDELAILEAQGKLSTYVLLPAAQADLARRLGHFDDARHYYRRALELVGNGTERRFLSQRLAELGEP